jgi:hypothetical protein
LEEAKEGAMKSRNWISDLMAAGIAITAMTANAGDNPRPRPFSGTVVGDVHWEILGVGQCAPQQDYITISKATGQMSHLGLTTMTENHCAGADSFPVWGTVIFGAANGDELWGTVVVGSCAWGESGDAWFSETCDYTINGGTGRFGAASGSLHVTVYLWPTAEYLGPWPANFVWKGSISY